MATRRQVTFGLSVCWGLQMLVAILFYCGIRDRCLFLFPYPPVLTAIMFVCFFNFAAIVATNQRGYHPVALVIFGTVLIVLGLVAISVIVAIGTHNYAWSRDRRCLVDTEVCLSFEYKSYSTTSSSHIESGCCVPPAVCGFSRYTESCWGNATNLDSHPDCRRWSNDQETLCFDCESCQTGVRLVLKKVWLITLVVSIFIQICSLAILVIALPLKANEGE